MDRIREIIDRLTEIAIQRKELVDKLWLLDDESKRLLLEETGIINVLEAQNESQKTD